MDKKTLSSYSTIPLAIALVILSGMVIQPDPTHYCVDERTQRYCDHISNGKHTRCYYTPENVNGWDTCSTGWEPISEWATDCEQPEQTHINANGCKHICPYGEIHDYTVCTCDNGQFGYVGELI